MPGYILHLAAAKILLDKYNLPVDQNDFYIGNLLPDAVKDKSDSHFRLKERRGKIVEYPEVELFREKYQALMGDNSVLGYYYHLYIDRKFFVEYYPKVFQFLNSELKEEEEREKVRWVYINKSKTIVPVQLFSSEEYYYGDFTRMNTWLVEKLCLPTKFHTELKNPGIEEVDYEWIESVLEELQRYCGCPTEAVQELKVFELEDLLAFLEKAADDWIVQRYK